MSKLYYVEGGIGRCRLLSQARCVRGDMVQGHRVLCGPELSILSSSFSSLRVASHHGDHPAAHAPLCLA